MKVQKAQINLKIIWEVYKNTNEINLNAQVVIDGYYQCICMFT